MGLAISCTSGFMPSRPIEAFRYTEFWWRLPTVCPIDSSGW